MKSVLTSLRARVVLALALVLALSALLTGAALERAFQDAARSSRADRLLAQIHLLISAAEVLDGGGLVMPSALAESRLSFPGSGLSARIFDADGAPLWQSPSSVGASEPGPLVLAPAERRLVQRDLPDGSGYLVAALGLAWITDGGARRLTFAVAEDLAPLRREVARFRASLWQWLGVSGLLTLMALTLALGWGLGPLGRVAVEVAAVESGRQARIHGRYPTELRALTGNLNALLAAQAAREQRLDHALGDLAHSLKTPLAVIQGALGESGLDAGGAALVREQLVRMADILHHQLQRARVGAHPVGKLAPSIPIAATCERVLRSLTKVYGDKPVLVDLDLDPGAQFRGAESDLMELLGNLLDNAFKWCQGRVRVSAAQGPEGLRILVEDDGPGMDTTAAEALLERGVRADESRPGHGLGLAMVREIARAQGGTIEFRSSSLGGAAVGLDFPAIRSDPSSP